MTPWGPKTEVTPWGPKTEVTPWGPKTEVTPWRPKTNLMSTHVSKTGVRAHVHTHAHARTSQSVRRAVRIRRDTHPRSACLDVVHASRVAFTSVHADGRQPSCASSEGVLFESSPMLPLGSA